MRSAVMMSRIALCVLIETTVVSSFAEGGVITRASISSEQKQSMIARHKKMAEMHSEMVSCIKANKSLEECREEMRKRCLASFGEGCPLFRMGHMGGAGAGGGNCFDWITNSDDPGNSSKNPERK